MGDYEEDTSVREERRQRRRKDDEGSMFRDFVSGVGSIGKEVLSSAAAFAPQAAMMYYQGKAGMGMQAPVNVHNYIGRGHPVPTGEYAESTVTHDALASGATTTARQAQTNAVERLPTQDIDTSELDGLLADGARGFPNAGKVRPLATNSADKSALMEQKYSMDGTGRSRPKMRGRGMFDDMVHAGLPIGAMIAGDVVGGPAGGMAAAAATNAAIGQYDNDKQASQSGGRRNRRRR